MKSSFQNLNQRNSNFDCFREFRSTMAVFFYQIQKGFLTPELAHFFPNHHPLQCPKEDGRYEKTFNTFITFGSLRNARGLPKLCIDLFIF